MHLTCALLSLIHPHGPCVSFLLISVASVAKNQSCDFHPQQLRQQTNLQYLFRWWSLSLCQHGCILFGCNLAGAAGYLIASILPHLQLRDLGALLADLPAILRPDEHVISLVVVPAAQGFQL